MTKILMTEEEHMAEQFDKYLKKIIGKPVEIPDYVNSAEDFIEWAKSVDVEEMK